MPAKNKLAGILLFIKYSKIFRKKELSLIITKNK